MTCEHCLRFVTSGDAQIEVLAGYFAAQKN